MTRIQCKACPWKVTTVPDEDIPDGYCATKHAGLKGTIAKPGTLNLHRIKIMACHESDPGKEQACVGWMHHQLGPGNNIGLRLAAMRDNTLYDFKVVGEQHRTFEDTLP